MTVAHRLNFVLSRFDFVLIVCARSVALGFFFRCRRRFGGGAFSLCLCLSLARRPPPPRCCTLAKPRAPRPRLVAFAAAASLLTRAPSPPSLAPAPPFATPTGKLPTTHDAEALKSADPKGKQKKNLRTYVVHSAREHLGEPVGQKHEA